MESNSMNKLTIIILSLVTGCYATHNTFNEIPEIHEKIKTLHELTASAREQQTDFDIDQINTILIHEGKLYARIVGAIDSLPQTSELEEQRKAFINAALIMKKTLDSIEYCQSHQCSQETVQAINKIIN